MNKPRKIDVGGRSLARVLGGVRGINGVYCERKTGNFYALLKDGGIRRCAVFEDGVGIYRKEIHEPLR
jgi:hypothetical protein